MTLASVELRFGELSGIAMRRPLDARELEELIGLARRSFALFANDQAVNVLAFGGIREPVLAVCSCVRCGARVAVLQRDGAVEALHPLREITRSCHWKAPGTPALTCAACDCETWSFG